MIRIILEDVIISQDILIPILKDLPWWVFGLRYLFGFNSTANSRRELVVLIKAELVPTIEERMAETVKPQDLIH